MLDHLFCDRIEQLLTQAYYHQNNGDYALGEFLEQEAFTLAKEFDSGIDILWMRVLA